MFKGVPYVNKIIKRRQEDRVMENHFQKLRSIRPLTSGLQTVEGIRVLNNRKKQMINEDRFTEIERQNRILLNKITSTLNKRNSVDLGDRQRMNKSLNSNFRKKQLQSIEIQNAKLLKRLQERKSDYEVEKLKQDWKKKKEVIRNIANFPLILRDKPRKQSRNRGISMINEYESRGLGSDIEMMRIRNIDGVNFIVTVKLGAKSMQIIGDNKKAKEVKLIQIGREQAIQFIEQECGGRIQLIFDRLRYDNEEQALYLLGKGAEMNREEDDQQTLKVRINKNPQQLILEDPNESKEADLIERL